MKVFVVHLYDAAGHLHDYYVHQTVNGAVQAAAGAVIVGSARARYAEDLGPATYALELQRVIAATVSESGVGRQHVRCGTWVAHVDALEVQP